MPRHLNGLVKLHAEPLEARHREAYSAELVAGISETIAIGLIVGSVREDLVGIYKIRRGNAPVKTLAPHIQYLPSLVTIDRSADIINGSRNYEITLTIIRSIVGGAQKVVI